MGLILVSSKLEGYVFKVGFPVGVAVLEIHGETHHLNKPYLFVQYIEPGSINNKSYAGYDLTGWVFGCHDDNITTAKLLKVLHRLGFSIGAHTLRQEIMKGTDILVEHEIKNIVPFIKTA